MKVDGLLFMSDFFVRHLTKYADRINTKYAEILSCVFYGESLAGVSCRRRWPAPTTVHYKP